MSKFDLSFGVLAWGGLTFLLKVYSSALVLSIGKLLFDSLPYQPVERFYLGHLVTAENERRLALICQNIKSVFIVRFSSAYLQDTSTW